MSHDTDKLIRQLSLVAFLMAERRPITARDVKSNVEGYQEMSDEAFARRFYSDRAELVGLGVPLDSQRDEFTGEELYTLRSERYFLPPLDLDDDELAALQTCLYLLEGRFAYSEPLRLALQNLALVLWSGDFHTVRPWHALTPIRVAGTAFNLSQVGAFVIAIGLTIALVAFMRLTHTGRVMRATAQDRDAAILMGIDTDRVYRITFALGIAAVGAAGVLVSPLYAVYPTAGLQFEFRGDDNEVDPEGDTALLAAGHPTLTALAGLAVAEPGSGARRPLQVGARLTAPTSSTEDAG